MQQYKRQYNKVKKGAREQGVLQLELEKKKRIKQKTEIKMEKQRQELK